VLKQIKISNYKSIDTAVIDLGRVNVFIGENGAGKSNVLEAIALACAADAAKLDNEFLIARGIRVTAPEFMRSAFKGKGEPDPIKLTMIAEEGGKFSYVLTNDGKPYSTWSSVTKVSSGGSADFIDRLGQFLNETMAHLSDEEREKKSLEISNSLSEAVKNFQQANDTDPKSFSINIDLGEREISTFPTLGKAANDFVIFSPENTALRTFAREGQIEPLGINGEGLFKLLSVMSRDPEAGDLESVRSALRMLRWFQDFTVDDTGPQSKINIVDRFLDSSMGAFDQRSVNEGFLFIIFYFALFLSPLTPKFFAIDNIDASLNPRLCEELIRQLTRLAKIGQKQVILTTHQPAVLDGLDLNDSDQRLFIVSRSSRGLTKVKRYTKPLPEGYPRRMSELFLSGAIGGLPKGF
jgi:predicted ATPase